MKTDDTVTSPRIPEVGEFVRGLGRLREVSDPKPIPPPPPSPMDYIFEQIVARCELRRNGRTLHTYETLNDFYGEGTCVVGAIERAEKICEQETITPTSEVEIVVVRTVSYVRMRPVRRGLDDDHIYDRRFRSFHPVENGAGWNVPPAVSTDVWSSRYPEKKES